MEQNEQTVERVYEYLSGLNIMKRKTSGKIFMLDSDGFLVLEITTKSRNAYTHRKLLPIPKELDDDGTSKIVGEALRRLSRKRNIKFSTGWVSLLERHCRTEREIYESLSPNPEIRTHMWQIYRIRNGLDKLVPLK